MLNCYKQLNPRGNLAPKEEQPLAAEETRGGSSLLRTVRSCLEALMDWFDQMKKALNDKNPFMEVSTLSLGWLSSTRTLRRISRTRQSRLNSLSRLLRRLGTAERKDAVMIKAQMIELTNGKKKPKPSWIPKRHPSTWIVWRARNNRKHIFSHNGNTHSFTGTRRLKAKKSSPTSRRKQIL